MSVLNFRLNAKPVNFYKEYDHRNSHTPPIPEKPHAEPSPGEKNQALTQQNPEIKFKVGIFKYPKQVYIKYPNTRSRSKN